MTEREATKIRSAFNNGFEYPFGGGLRENCDMKEVNRHAELLDEAIKKQIPKMPIRNRQETIRYTDAYSCPNCGGNFSATGVAEYCYHCGQQLDWTEFINYMPGGGA